jgi:hypothetical protein
MTFECEATFKVARGIFLETFGRAPIGFHLGHGLLLRATLGLFNALLKRLVKFFSSSFLFAQQRFLKCDRIIAITVKLLFMPSCH